MLNIPWTFCFHSRATEIFSFSDWTDWAICWSSVDNSWDMALVLIKA
jgi:hypothetical protein